MFKRFCTVLLVFLIISNTVVWAKDLNISAQSTIVIDSKTHHVIYEKDAYSNRAIASTTKIMTCLLACESKRLSEEIVITDEMLEGAVGSLIYLNAGDRISLYDLVCGAMIASGNDAANAIALTLSNSIYDFAVLMNNKAKEIGMKSTEFVTPSGLDESNNHSTAYDLAILSAYALNNEELTKVASMKSCQICVNDEKRTLYNHNKLLSFDENFIGVKTGFTNKAGRCLVSAYKYSGNTIICVTLNAPNDWEDHKKLVKYAKKCYKDINRSCKLKISVVGAEKHNVKCIYSCRINAVDEIEIKLYYYPFAYAPINKGDVLGRADIYCKNALIKSVDIIADEEIKNGK